MTDSQRIQKIEGILALLREESEKVHAQKMYIMELNANGWITNQQRDEITAAIKTQVKKLSDTGDALRHLSDIIGSKYSILPHLPEDIQAKVNWPKPTPLTEEEKQLILKAENAFPNEYEAMGLTCLPTKAEMEAQK